jgi:predicted GTPase
VLVVEDGPTVTHGGMPFGAATVAARAAGAGSLVDARPSAVGSIAGVFERYPHIGPVLPAMGYGDRQLADLAATIAATPCDVVVTGTPIDLAAAMRDQLGPDALHHPVRHVRYDLDAHGQARLAAIVDGWLADQAR